PELLGQAQPRRLQEVVEALEEGEHGLEEAVFVQRLKGGERQDRVGGDRGGRDEARAGATVRRVGGGGGGGASPPLGGRGGGGGGGPRAPGEAVRCRHQGELYLGQSSPVHWGAVSGTGGLPCRRRLRRRSCHASASRSGTLPLSSRCRPVSRLPER